MLICADLAKTTFLDITFDSVWREVSKVSKTAVELLGCMAQSMKQQAGQFNADIHTLAGLDLGSGSSTGRRARRQGWRESIISGLLQWRSGLTAYSDEQAIDK